MVTDTWRVRTLRFEVQVGLLIGWKGYCNCSVNVDGVGDRRGMACSRLGWGGGIVAWRTDC